MPIFFCLVTRLITGSIKSHSSIPISFVLTRLLPVPRCNDLVLIARQSCFMLNRLRHRTESGLLESPGRYWGGSVAIGCGLPTGNSGRF